MKVNGATEKTEENGIFFILIKPMTLDLLKSFPLKWSRRSQLSDSATEIKRMLH